MIYFLHQGSSIKGPITFLISATSRGLSVQTPEAVYGWEGGVQMQTQLKPLNILIVNFLRKTFEKKNPSHDRFKNS